MIMGLAAFNAMRRRQAEQAAKEAAEAAKSAHEQDEVVNVPEEPNEPEMGQNESDARPLSTDDVEDMEIERIKEFLDQMNIKYAHNTSENKLREKLINAIG
jgi:predicted Zn-dependent protease